MSVDEELKQIGVDVQPAIKPSEVWIAQLKQLGYTFRLNLCDDSIEIGTHGAKISDLLEAEIRTRLRDVGVTKGFSAIQDAYMTEAKRHGYHPIRDHFHGMHGKWDSIDRITELCSKITSASPDLVYDDGTSTPIHAIYLVRWMIGVIAKVLDGRQNPMLTLDGAQGIGKSLLSRWLCSMGDEWYIDGPIVTSDKDSDVRLMTKLIWEVSELDATFRRADVSALKAFLTKSQVTVRKAYARHDVTKPAMASFIGTINSSASGFLSDDTGNRRFLVINVASIDWSYNLIDRYQLWCQVYALYSEGTTGALTPDELRMQEQINESYMVSSPIDDWIIDAFHFGDIEGVMSMGDIIDHLVEKDHKLHGSERAQAMEIARAIQKFGCTKVHTRTGKKWAGITAKH